MGQREIAQASVDAAFSVWGDQALYIAPDGAQALCRIVVKGGDEYSPVEGMRVMRGARFVQVRATDISPVSGGAFTPGVMRGLDFEACGDPMVISAPPRREDPLRLVWTCEVPA